MFLHPEMCLFTNCSSSDTCIMVLLKLNFVFHFFLHCCVGDDLWYTRYKTWASVVQAGALLMLFFAGMLPQEFKELEVK